MVVVYLLFVLLTWVADPLFNLLLRFDKFGRLALSREQVQASNWFGAVLGLALAGTAAAAVLDSGDLLLVSVGIGILVLPITAVFRCRPGWPRMTMAGYTVLLVLLMAGALYRKELPGYVGIAVIGAVLSTWVGSGLSLARSRSRD